MKTTVDGDVISSTMRGRDIGGSSSVEHSHPVGTSSIIPGPGDDAAVNAGKPNNIVNSGNVVVVEKVDGQFRTRVLTTPALPGSTMRSIVDQLNVYQRRIMP
jgi:hypothetical protein